MKDEKRELYLKIEELKDKIVGLTAEENTARELIRELLETKAQIDNTPLILNMGEVENEREDVFRANEYEVVKTDRGILYHEYGGYSIFVAPNNKIIYDILSIFWEERADEDGISEEERNDRKERNDALSFTLGIPRLAFIDVDTTIALTTCLVENIERAVANSMDAPLQDDDIEANEEFRENALELEELKKKLKEE